MQEEGKMDISFSKKNVHEFLEKVKGFVF